MYGSTEILVGDVRERLAELAASSFHVAICSPPYWNLRDYGAEGQIGREPTPTQFVEDLADVFDDVRRVLRDDALLFVNLGDTYATNPSNDDRKRAKPDRPLGSRLLIPERFALTMQARGWILRSVIVWAKAVSFCPTYHGAAMPHPHYGTRFEVCRTDDGERCSGCEACDDGLFFRRGAWRPTDAFEPVFVFAQSMSYYADGEAIREANGGSDEYHPQRRLSKSHQTDRPGDVNRYAYRDRDEPEFETMGRNVRNVWTVNLQPIREQHWATYPEQLVEPMIRAATSERGVCPSCGAPFARILDRPPSIRGERAVGAPDRGNDQFRPNGQELAARGGAVTLGWRPTCDCANIGDPVRARVLDPFVGSGTTVLVAAKIGRDGVGIELSPESAAIARRRIGRGLRPSTFRDDNVTVPAPLFEELEP